MSPKCIFAFGNVRNEKFFYNSNLAERKFSEEKELSEAESKLDFNLLKLINNDYLLKGQSREELISEMKELKQFVSENDSVKIVDNEIENKNHGDLVYVYVYVNNGEPLSVTYPFVWEIVDVDTKNNFMAALIEVKNLKLLAQLSEIKSIRTVMSPTVRRGSVLSEGDLIHKTDQVRSDYFQSGSGIKIGVISDGVDHIASSQASGDLPTSVIVLGNSVGGDEGTAMLEIIYDMVPDAELYFHDCGSNVLAFNTAINDLISAGVDIIVDDIGWISEPFFEDGVIATHVSNIITNNNILYVSAAGNDATQHYQGNFYNDGENFHDFSSDPIENDYLYVNLPVSSRVIVILQWNENFGLSSSDYDLYLFNTNDYSQLASSTSEQNGDDDPIEYLTYTNTTGSEINVEIDVNNYQGLAPVKNLELFIYTSDGAYNYPNNIVASDSIFGHPAVPNVIAVGAIDANDSDNDTIEYFSSQGPVTIIGESQRTKPDIAGIDGVTITGAGGFSSPFFGTSAAAPHIAAILAQLWGAHPSANADKISNHILKNSIDLGIVGSDNVFGYGRANSLFAFQTSSNPMASIAGGNHYAPVYVALTAFNSSEIRYTMDGSTPTCSSSLLYSSPILLSSTTTLKAIGCNTVSSEIMTETYYINSPASTWYLAEGYTGSGFQTYVLLQNPNDVSATVDVTYMIEGESNVSKQYTIGPNTRYTIPVNNEIGNGKSVSTKVSADQNIIVERAEYWDGGGIHWVGGHNTIGVN